RQLDQQQIDYRRSEALHAVAPAVFIESGRPADSGWLQQRVPQRPDFAFQRRPLIVRQTIEWVDFGPQYHFLTLGRQLERLLSHIVPVRVILETSLLIVTRNHLFHVRRWNGIDPIRGHHCSEEDRKYEPFGENHCRRPPAAALQVPPRQLPGAAP